MKEKRVKEAFSRLLLLSLVLWSLPSSAEWNSTICDRGCRERTFARDGDLALSNDWVDPVENAAKCQLNVGTNLVKWDFMAVLDGQLSSNLQQRVGKTDGNVLPGSSVLLAIRQASLAAIVIQDAFRVAAPTDPNTWLPSGEGNASDQGWLSENDGKPVETASTPASAERGGNQRVIDLNLATLDDLCALPGIGPKKAQAILHLRAKRPFTRVTQILQVRGIGRKTLERLRPYLTIGSTRAAQPSSRAKSSSSQ